MEKREENREKETRNQATEEKCCSGNFLAGGLHNKKGDSFLQVQEQGGGAEK